MPASVSPGKIIVTPQRAAVSQHPVCPWLRRNPDRPDPNRELWSPGFDNYLCYLGSANKRVVHVRPLPPIDPISVRGKS